LVNAKKKDNRLQGYYLVGNSLANTIIRGMSEERREMSVKERGIRDERREKRKKCSR